MRYGRIERRKIRIAALDKSDIGADKLGNATITDIETRSAYENLPIGGIKISTADGWIAARPSGTEDLYKLYSESYRSDEEAESLCKTARYLLMKLCVTRNKKAAVLWYFNKHLCYNDRGQKCIL